MRRLINNYPVGKTAMTLGKFNSLSIKIELGGEKQRKRKEKQHLPLTPSFFEAQLHSLIPDL